jgi:hypothetical protein
MSFRDAISKYLSRHAIEATRQTLHSRPDLPFRCLGGEGFRD